MSQKALIWDFDGTLVDSYGAINQALEVTYQHFDLPYDEAFATAFVLKESVGALLRQLSTEYALPFDQVLAFFNQEQEARDHLIEAKPFVQEALQAGRDLGYKHYIFTHKGSSTQAVLEELGLADYFDEVVTSANGFARKPAPDALLYLLDRINPVVV